MHDDVADALAFEQLRHSAERSMVGSWRTATCRASIPLHDFEIANNVAATDEVELHVRDAAAVLA